jgi:hypothetical protein
MKKKISVLLIIMFVLSSLYGCGGGAADSGNPNNSQSSGSGQSSSNRQGTDDSQGAGNSQETDNSPAPSQAPSANQDSPEDYGYNITLQIRDPQNSDEALAMEYVNALRARDYSTMVAMADLTAFAPVVPMVIREEYIADMIFEFSGASEQYKQIVDYTDYDFKNDMWNGTLYRFFRLERLDGESNYTPGAIGIVETNELGIVVAHSFDGTREGFYRSGINSSRGTNEELYGGFFIRINIVNGKVVPAPYEDFGFIEGDTTISVLRNSIVTFRGNVIEPTTLASGITTTDSYTLSDIKYGIPEEISVDTQGYLGIMRLFVYGHFGNSGEDGRVRNTYGYERYGDLNLKTMAITMPEYQGLVDEIEHDFRNISDTIFGALERNDVDGMDNVLFSGGSAGSANEKRNRARNFDSWHEGENNPSEINLIGAERDLVILRIIAVSGRSVDLHVMHTATLANGQRFYFESDERWTLTRNTDTDVWQVFSLDSNIFSRRASVWKEMPADTQNVLDLFGHY